MLNLDVSLCKFNSSSIFYNFLIVPINRDLLISNFKIRLLKYYNAHDNNVLFI